MTVSIGKRKFSSVEEAVNEYESGDIIRLDSNTVEDTVFFGKRIIVLDLNGKKLTNKIGPAVSVLMSCTLRIMDNSKEKSGTIDSVLNNVPAILVEAKANLYMDGGNVTRSDEDSNTNTANCILNYGNATICDGVKVVSTSIKNAAIRSGFDTNKASDRKYIADIGLDYNAKMIVSGGTIIGGQIALKNDEYGYISVTGGTISSSKEALLTWSPCNITGGTFTATEGPAVAFGTNKGPAGMVTISGGSFTGSTSTGPVAPINPAKPHSTPQIVGGLFNQAPAEEYYPESMEIRSADGGMVTLVSRLWDISYVGVNKLILHKDLITYASGGIEMPIPSGENVLIAATSKNGTLGYFNSVENKVQLFHGASEVKAGPVEDLTIVFLVR